ncbi:MAG: cbb3-type cytochrome oxidase assembly protein CcoS [Sandaracinaceae bacterium]
MEVLIITVSVSLALAAGGVGLFVWSVRQGTFEHSDRLALLPLEDEDATTAPPDGATDHEDASAKRRS